jgi:hypothetical protein
MSPKFATCSKAEEGYQQSTMRSANCSFFSSCCILLFSINLASVVERNVGNKLPADRMGMSIYADWLSDSLTIQIERRGRI